MDKILKKSKRPERISPPKIEERKESKSEQKGEKSKSV